MKTVVCAMLAAIGGCAGLALQGIAAETAGGYFSQTPPEGGSGVQFLANAPGTPSDTAASPLYEDTSDQPTWTAWAGAIFLTRSDPKFRPLLGDSNGSFFNASGFDFNTVAGPDLNVIRHGPDFDVDFRYFQVNQVRASRPLFGGDGVQLLLDDPIDLGDGLFNVSYVSSLQSVELNLRQNVHERISLLAGFRYVSLREDFGVTFDLFNDAIGAHAIGINRLYGFQIGADTILLNWNRFQLQSALKAGIYGNNAQNQLRLDVFDDFDLSTGRTRQTTSFVGDLNFTGVYRLTDHIAVRAGYQLLWLSGVALASEQVPTLGEAIFGQPSVHTTGDVFLHGALVSCQVSW